MQRSVRSQAQELGEQLVFWRRHLHRYPEVGFSEHSTAAFIEEVLQEEGLTPRRVAETGVVVDIQGAHSGPLRAYRADIDALPIQEVKDEDIPYCSQTPGVAHLCGHDAHTAMALGVAVLLARQREDLHGDVRILFQPAEEPTPSGAPGMIEAGVLEGVKWILAFHVDPRMPVGTFGFKAGVINAASDSIRITIESERTGHSSEPHRVADPVWIAVQLASLLYQLPGRVHDARYPSVWALTYLKAGGEALNVIPQVAHLGGTLRSTEEEARELMLQRIEALAQELTRVHGARARLNIQRGAPPVVNDARIIARAMDVCREVFGEKAVQTYTLPSMGGEDFAHYLKHVPGALIRIGVSGGTRSSYALHDARFDIDERALPLGVAFMTELLRREELR